MVAVLLIARRKRVLTRGGDSALSAGKSPRGPFGPAPKDWSAPVAQRPEPHARYSSRHSSWVLHAPPGSGSDGVLLSNASSTTDRHGRDESSTIRPASNRTGLESGTPRSGHGAGSAGSAGLQSGPSGPDTASGPHLGTAQSPGMKSGGSGSGSGSRRAVTEVRGEVQQAVAALQGALQEELHEDELQLYDVLGRGGFGTVYHGTPPFPCPAASGTLPHPPHLLSSFPTPAAFFDKLCG